MILKLPKGVHTTARSLRSRRGRRLGEQGHPLPCRDARASPQHSEQTLKYLLNRRLKPETFPGKDDQRPRSYGI